MNVQKAAREMRQIIKNCDPAFEPARSEDGKGVDHALWMLEGIIAGYIQHEKGHRWLGYAQAICVVEEVGTLDDMKQTNVSA
ncbi:MAG: hypothetical protein JRD89_17130 [Deltaproteobacteria bacterium]|nr:hypothetical protein [Deltaproteobacteria bacterium]